MPRKIYIVDLTQERTSLLDFINVFLMRRHCVARLPPGKRLVMNNEPLSIGSSLPPMLATSSNVSIQLYQNHREKVLAACSYYSLISLQRYHARSVDKQAHDPTPHTTG